MSSFENCEVFPLFAFKMHLVCMTVDFEARGCLSRFSRAYFVVSPIKVMTNGFYNKYLKTS